MDAVPNYWTTPEYQGISSLSFPGWYTGEILPPVIDPPYELNLQRHCLPSCYITERVMKEYGQLNITIAPEYGLGTCITPVQYRYRGSSIWCTGPIQVQRFFGVMYRSNTGTEVLRYDVPVQYRYRGSSVWCTGPIQVQRFFDMMYRSNTGTEVLRYDVPSNTGTEVLRYDVPSNTGTEVLRYDVPVQYRYRGSSIWCTGPIQIQRFFDMMYRSNTGTEVLRYDVPVQYRYRGPSIWCTGPIQVQRSFDMMYWSNTDTAVLRYDVPVQYRYRGSSIWCTGPIQVQRFFDMMYRSNTGTEVLRYDVPVQYRYRGSSIWCTGPIQVQRFFDMMYRSNTGMYRGSSIWCTGPIQVQRFFDMMYRYNTGTEVLRYDVPHWIFLYAFSRDGCQFLQENPGIEETIASFYLITRISSFNNTFGMWLYLTYLHRRCCPLVVVDRGVDIHFDIHINCRARLLHTCSARQIGHIYIQYVACALTLFC